MYENVVYISGLKPDFDYLDLEGAIQLDGNPDEIIQDYVIHNNNAIFLSLADTRFVDKVISRYDGKQLLGSGVHVSRLTQELAKVLNQLKPLGHKVATVGFGEVNPMPLSNPVPPSGGFNFTTGMKPLAGLGDILEAFDSLSVEQQLQLKATLQLKPVQSLATPYKPVTTSTPYHFVHRKPDATIPKQMQAPPMPEQSFHFGNANVNSIRVSTFSGGSKDCSFEQFRYDVQSLVKQGCPEGAILTAIRRSIKDQAQEILLHMGEEATVADILCRYEMMFGDVNPSHVLLAQFYAAEQLSSETMTAWYARLEDLASRIIRKDASIITPDNYDIIVNTQFWTKMYNEQMKNALRHKFDVMSNHSQFVVEARKVESEFTARTAKVHQANVEPVPWLKQSLDSIMERLSALESKTNPQVQPSTQDQSQAKPQSMNSRPRGNKPGKSSNIRCWGCNQVGHVRSKCPLNLNRSEGGSGPTR